MNNVQKGEMPVIKVAAAIINDTCGRTLLVRKRGTDYFMQAGGKMDGDEKPLDALIRELKEELNLEIAGSDAQYIGRYTAAAANEEGFLVDAELFLINIDHEVEPSAEIEEIA